MVKDNKVSEEPKRTRRIKKEDLEEESEVEEQSTKKTSRSKSSDSEKKPKSKGSKTSSVESDNELPKKKSSRSKKVSKPVSSDNETSHSDSDDDVDTKKTSKTNKKTAKVAKPKSQTPKVQKPLKVDNDGINFSTSRVRGYVQSNVLNSPEVANAINELKEHKEALLKKEDTVFTESHLLTNEVREFLTNLAKNDTQVRREKLERAGRKLHLENLDDEEKVKFKEQLKTLGDSPDKVSKFFKKLNKSFYTEFNETNPANSVGEAAWKYYYGKLVRGQTKVMNKDATLYLTCFIEEILRQTFSHLCLTSVSAGSKSLNLQHMNNVIDGWNDKNFYFGSLVRNLSVWKFTSEWVNEEGYKKRVKGEERAELLLPNLDEYKENKTGFEVYVDHVCKQVKRDFDLSPPKIDYNEGNKDLFGTITLSKELKAFGVSLVIELLNLVGQFILLETSSRRVRSINHELMVDIVNLFVTANNLNDKLDEVDSTLQTMYNRTVICLEKRKAENALKAKKNGNGKKGKPKSKVASSSDADEDDSDNEEEEEVKPVKKQKKKVAISDNDSASDNEHSKKRSSSKSK